MNLHDPSGEKHKPSGPTIIQLLEGQFRLLLEDVIVPIRVVLATTVVFVVFLMAEQIIFFLIGWSVTDIRSRIPYVNWVLDGIQLLSLVAVGIYFSVSGISNLHTQWKINSSIETRAGLK